MHFLVWMACSAVSLAITRALNPTDAFTTDWYAIYAVYHALQSPSVGAALGGLLLFATRRLREMDFPVYPGEWLLVALGVLQVFDMGFKAVFGYLLSWVLWEPAFDWVFAIRHSIVPGGVFLMLAIRANVPVRWRTFFWSLVVIKGFDFLTVILGFPDRLLMATLSGIFAVLVLVVVVLIDLRTRLVAPWTHWAGVAAFLWSGLVAFGFRVWFFLVVL